MENEEQLSKKEKIRLKHEQERSHLEHLSQQKKRNRFIFLVCIAILVVGGIVWAYKKSTAPTPGQTYPDEGRQHVEPGTKVDYKQNPPTSGSHYEEWEKAGIYDTVLLDEKLVHSLEHGYIIFSYNCDAKKTGYSIIQSAYALEPPLTATPTPEQATSSAILKWQEDTSCKELVKNLTDFANELKVWKLIVVPRPNMDSRIILTAWNHMQKFTDIDKEQITAFVDAYRDRGPEQTMEP